MPKELIYGESLPFGTPEEPGPARAVVDVRWDRETGYFQIATRCIDALTNETFKPDNEVEAELAVNQTTLYDGFYVDLDRRSINELIRTLRRARNAAFGADE